MGGKKRTHKEFVELIANLYPQLEVVSDFTETKNRVNVLCRKCNTTSSPIANNLILQCFKCKQCDYIERKNNFMNKIITINPHIRIIGEYKNLLTKITCECLIHNEYFSMTAGNLIAGHGCPKCAIESRRKAFAKSHDDFISELKKVSPSINVTSRYISSHQKIKCQCTICHHEWVSVPHSLLRGDGCPKCNTTSRGETAIAKALDNLNIEYITQKKFSDCRNQNPLAFDFYIPTHNMCIEFQGQQHYEAIEYFGGENEFNIRKKRDGIKEKYCQENNIGLLCIPYWEFNYIQQIMNALFTEEKVDERRNIEEKTRVS